MTSRTDELELELWLHKAQDAFTAAKVARAAGEFSDKKWEAAKRDVTRERVRHRVSQNRPGSENFRVAEDGTVISVRTKSELVKVRDENGNIDAAASHLERTVVETVI